VRLRERGLEAVQLHSAAADRPIYLARPDLGRRLDDASRAQMAAMPRGYDLAFVLADGLSARAVASHAVPLLDETLPQLSCQGLRIGPVAIVEQGRVAVGDEIGHRLGAALVCVLIGERPGLTSPDSLGAYLTWQPAPGRTDAERNCLSNIRPAGMACAEAAQRLVYLCTQARLRRCTGVMLKDETPSPSPRCRTTARVRWTLHWTRIDVGLQPRCKTFPDASSIPARRAILGLRRPGILYNSVRPSGRVEYPAMNSPSPPRSVEATARIAVPPLEDTSTFADRAYTALRDVILSLDIYNRSGEVRLDERQLASDLGISRTPVREAMVQLEREGFVRAVPRRGIYVVRKTKREVIELITAWAALECMAARLITQKATDQEIAGLRAMFATFENGRLHAKLDEYSEVNIEFHQTIIRMSGNQVLIDLAANLFAHMRMIRRKTIGESDRADRSISDHMNIIRAIEARDTARAEALVRDHALGLAEHVTRHADYLD
jgi:DNA-binding GntR family transcriptional regulator